MPQTISAGEVFFTSAGSYSDYGVHALMRAMVDIDVEAAQKEWKASWPLDGYGARANYVSLEHWLVNVKHIAEELPMNEWWLDD